MIKDIFLPEKIHSFYLFTRRIVAFEINDHAILATVIRAHRSKRDIQKFIEEPYNAQELDGLTNALKAILKKIGSYDDAYVALPSSLAVFKSIELPFTSPEKIKLVLPFEVESLLPFPLQDAVIDAVVNTTDIGRTTSQVFVVATKRSLLDAAITPFLNAGVRIKKVTIGALELYGLLRSYNLYDVKGISFVIDLLSDRTTILLLVNNQLRAIRVLAEGISNETIRSQLDEHHTLDTATQHFFAKIQFTIQAMIKNERMQEPITSILLTGAGAYVPEITSYIGELFDCSCSALQPHKILVDGNITLDNESSIPPLFTTCLATALNSPLTEELNLGRLYETTYELQQFKYQTTTAIVLLLCIFLSLLEW